MHLDESKVEQLRQWGQALRGAGSEESAAAGRAILMLLEELERLRLQLRLARNQPELGDQVPDSEVDAGVSEPVSSTLQQRLEQVLRRDSGPAAAARPEPVEGGGSNTDLETDSSAHSWIETLRRQK
jgi:hypothetical protein